MNRLLCIVALALALPTSAHAAGGVVFSLEYGFGTWNVDKAHLASQLPPPNQIPGEGDLAQLFVDNLHSGQLATARLGYNILGHATVEGFFSATGWNLTQSDRGGAGFAGGEASWHPLQLWRPDRPFDAEVLLGLGYGIAGEKKGAAGTTFLWGLRGQYNIGKFLFAGAGMRVHHLLFDEFYRDYNNRALGSNTIAIDGLGGQFWGFQVFLGAQVDPTAQ